MKIGSGSLRMSTTHQRKGTCENMNKWSKIHIPVSAVAIVTTLVTVDIDRTSWPIDGWLLWVISPFVSSLILGLIVRKSLVASRRLLVTLIVVFPLTLHAYIDYRYFSPPDGQSALIYIWIPIYSHLLFGSIGFWSVLTAAREKQERDDKNGWVS